MKATLRSLLQLSSTRSLRCGFNGSSSLCEGAVQVAEEGHSLSGRVHLRVIRDLIIFTYIQCIIIQFIQIKQYRNIANQILENSITATAWLEIK